MLEQFQQWYDGRHEYAKQWKERTGGKVAGTLCTYVPEEILYAAGMLPVRIIGSHEPQDVAEPHIFGMFCPFSRDALAQGLKGRYDYLDGIILSHSCLHYRQVFTSWKAHLPVEFSYYLPMPNQVQSSQAGSYWAEEVSKFKSFVESCTKRSLGDEELGEAIELVNRSRRLLRQTYEYRKLSPPPLTGTEAMYMAITSQFVDKREHNQAVARTLEELPHRQLPRETGTRLMTVGSENDDAEVFKMIESVGATVVIDEQCSGSRYFWNEAIPRQDHVRTIADRYVDRPPCPTKDYPQRMRFPHILGLAKEYGVQGAIIMLEKFCDPHQADNPALQRFLEENGLPTLTLEFDSTNPIGPLRTRVEAFLETLQEEELF